MDNKNVSNNNSNNFNSNNKNNVGNNSNNTVAVEGSNKQVLYYSIGAVVILVLIIIWAVSNSKKSALVGDVDNKVDQTVTIPTEDTSIGSVHAPKKKNTTPVVSMSYDEALAKYKDSRIQIGTECQAVPNLVTYKNNTTVMIDNRSSAERKIKIDTEYPIKAYGFKIIDLSSKTLPVTFLVDCDNYQNVATVLIQK